MSALATSPAQPRRSSGRGFVLCPWTTLRGNSSTAINLVQDSGDWLDLEEFSDATFQIEVSEVTNPSGATSGYVLLLIESSPTADESCFKTIAGPIACTVTVGSSPLTLKTASAGAAPLARYVRWRIVPTGPASTFDVTFRIRGSANRGLYFAPTQLASCLLWLRADIGLTFNNNTISGWADQTGNGYSASQATTGAQPTYSANGVNGLPAIQGDGSSKYMTTPSFASPSTATFFVVAQPAVTTQAVTARLVEQDNVTSYFLGADLAGTGYKFIVANNTSPFGTANTGTVQLAPSIVSATYDGTNGTIYYNGASPVSSAFPHPSNSYPLYLMSAYFVGSLWNGYFAELIVYQQALSATNLRTVHRYLGARYGIAVP